MGTLPQGLVGPGYMKQVDDSNNTIGVLGNPDVAIDQIRAAIQAGNGFEATIKQNAGAGLTQGIALFHDVTNTDNIFIYSAKGYQGGGSTTLHACVGTTDPAFGTPLTPMNLKNGGPASSFASAPSTCSSALTGLTDGAYGTDLDSVLCATNITIELFPGQLGYSIPAGVAVGFALYSICAAAGLTRLTVKWVKF